MHKIWWSKFSKCSKSFWSCIDAFMKLPLSNPNEPIISNCLPQSIFNKYSDSSVSLSGPLNGDCVHHQWEFPLFLAFLGKSKDSIITSEKAWRVRSNIHVLLNKETSKGTGYHILWDSWRNHLAPSWSSRCYNCTTICVVRKQLEVVSRCDMALWGEDS